MTPKRRTNDPEGASEPPELAPVEQSLRARIRAMNLAELEALAIAVDLEIQMQEGKNGE